jgi:hypothetical protein
LIKTVRAYISSSFIAYKNQFGISSILKLLSDLALFKALWTSYLVVVQSMYSSVYTLSINSQLIKLMRFVTSIRSVRSVSSASTIG